MRNLRDSETEISAKLKGARPNQRWLRLLDPLLVGLALVAYLIYLNNRDGQLRLAQNGAVLLLAIGAVARFWLTYPALWRTNRVLGWVRLNWTFLVLLIAIGLGGFVGLGAIKHPPILTQSETALVTNAVTIVKRSNWQTPSFSQPPLYLNLIAVVDEAAFLQQLGGQFGTPDDLHPDSFLDLQRLLNLALGLLTLLPLYGATARLYGKRAGAMAALLLALTWTHYSLFARLEPQTLAGFLLICSFYFGVRIYQEEANSWNPVWAGLLVGLATAACYGAVWWLVGLGLAWFASKTRRSVAQGFLQIGGSWVAGFTLGAAGWVLNLPGFLNGLGSIGEASDLGKNAFFYVGEFFRQDAGLLLIVSVGLILTLFWPRGREWLALSFVLAYLLSVFLVGPQEYFRLALLTPFAVIVAARPLELAAQWLQSKLDDDRHRWAGDAALVGLTLLIILMSVGVRRYLG